MHVVAGRDRLGFSAIRLLPDGVDGERTAYLLLDDEGAACSGCALLTGAWIAITGGRCEACCGTQCGHVPE